MSEGHTDMSGVGTTGVVVGASLAAGLAVDALRAVVGFTSDLNPGQATLVVGLLGLLFQVVKWLVERRAKPKGG